MWPDRVSNPGPVTYESDALPIELRSQASYIENGILFVLSGIASMRGF